MVKKLGLLLAVLGLAFAVLLLSSGRTRFASEAALTLPQPSAPIWERLTAVGDWPRWWPGVAAASLAPGWQPGAELQLALQGDPEQAPAVVELVSPEAALSWLRPGVLGSQTRTLLQLQPLAGGTRVVLRSEIQGPQAVLARWTAQEDFRRYQELVLQRLAEALERDAAQGLR
jgi:uncharacterized protein YndB with AHSA1/START domain